MPTARLDRSWSYGGKAYGPGNNVSIPQGLHDILFDKGHLNEQESEEVRKMLAGGWRSPEGVSDIEPEPDEFFVMNEVAEEDKGEEVFVTVTGGAQVLANGFVIAYVQDATAGQKTAVKTAIGATVDAVYGTINAEHVVFSVAKTAGQLEAAKASAEADANVAYVDYDEIIVANITYSVPNDFHPQNNRRTQRTRPNGLYDWNDQDNLAYMNVPRAWGISTGRRIKVSMIGTGYSKDSWEVAPKVNKEYDFLKKDNRADDDLRQHETACSSVVAAVTNNGKGMCGFAPQAKLLQAKVNDFDGTLTLSAFLNALNWSVNEGARVINMSLTFNPYNQSLYNWFNANKEKVVCVASAGNTGTRITNQYPAAYPGVIAVGGTTENTLSWWDSSTYGPWMDFAAPAANVIAAYPSSSDHYYVSTSFGTSMAAPHISGLAALILSKHPDWNTTQVYNAMKNACMERGGSGWDEKFGWGVPDAWTAVLQ